MHMLMALPFFYNLPRAQTFKPTHLINGIKSEIHETHTQYLWRHEQQMCPTLGDGKNGQQWWETSFLWTELQRLLTSLMCQDTERLFFCHLPVDTKGLKLVRTMEDNNVYCPRWWDYGQSVFGGKTSFPSCIRDFFQFNSCARFIIHLFGTTWPLLTNLFWWNGDIALIHPLWQHKLI